ncbi:MAG: endonuclease/exonuclease/phosphatase family protein [Gimesia sp.]|nr:endonuclease/exonuclease/phosphatase family protein [Gimesia sp.]
MKSKPIKCQINKLSEVDDQNDRATSNGLRNGLLKLFILLFSAFWVLALIIRLTVRDSAGVFLTLVFYISPLILLCLGAAIVFLFSWCVRWQRISLIWLILTLITGVWCWNTQFQKNEVPIALKDKQLPELRILFWNIGDRIWGMESVLDELRAVDADLIGLVEAGSDSAKMKRFWKETFPDHPFQIVKDGFVLLSRVPIANQQSGRLTEMGKYEFLDLELNQGQGRSVSVFLVDIKSNIFKSRKDALEQLAVQISAIKDHPILVLGDFNTPSDSDHFRPLRKWIKNSFEVAGDGYTATWPLPFPVLDLDSIWVNDQFVVISSENRWTWVSDHRPVITDVFLKTFKIN